MWLQDPEPATPPDSVVRDDLLRVPLAAVVGDDDLRASGIMSRVAKVGATAPDFTLPNVAGIIRAVDADPDYTRRSEPTRTVEVLEKLRRS